MAAYLADKQGGVINILKLVKLLYLADRAALARYGMPISYDRLVSMDHGPVMSRTLNLINGLVGGSTAAQWEEWITDRDNHDVSVHRSFERRDLDELSDADLEILQAVWSDFGKYDQWALRDYVHEHCKEWKDPDGSSLPLSDKDVLLALGKNDAEASRLAAEIAAERKLDSLFADL